MKKDKKEYNKKRHKFLLTLFPDQEEKYAILHMNGHVLVRQFNGGNSNWEVAIYTEESFKASRDYMEKQQTSLL